MKDIQKGFLIMQDNGRYGVIVNEFSCGQPVKVFINDELISGRIECNHQGKYYLLSDNNTSYDLEEGLEVIFED